MNIRILLVEDADLLASLYQRILGTLADAFPGATITRVQRLADAKSIICTLAPDAMVLDLTLEDATQAETIAEIHNIAQKNPVVVVTGSVDPGLRALVMERGASAFIHKTELMKDHGILVRAVVRAMAAFKDLERASLAHDIEALRAFALSHDGT